MVLLPSSSTSPHSSGLAMGVQSDQSSTVVLLFAILAHKATAAFALGVKYLDTSLTRRAKIGIVTAFSFITPCGIVFVGGHLGAKLGLNMGECICYWFLCWIERKPLTPAQGACLQEWTEDELTDYISSLATALASGGNGFSIILYRMYLK